MHFIANSDLTFPKDVVSRIKNNIPLALNDRGPTVYYGPFKTPDENYNDWRIG